MVLFIIVLSYFTLSYFITKISACFLMRKRKGVDLDGREITGEEWEEHGEGCLESEYTV